MPLKRLFFFFFLFLGCLVSCGGEIFTSGSYDCLEIKGSLFDDSGTSMGEITPGSQGMEGTCLIADGGWFFAAEPGSMQWARPYFSLEFYAGDERVRLTLRPESMAPRQELLLVADFPPELWGQEARREDTETGFAFGRLAFAGHTTERFAWQPEPAADLESAGNDDEAPAPNSITLDTSWITGEPTLAAATIDFHAVDFERVDGRLGGVAGLLQLSGQLTFELRPRSVDP